jgi:hypothetical protein
MNKTCFFSNTTKPKNSHEFGRLNLYEQTQNASSIQQSNFGRIKYLFFVLIAVTITMSACKDEAGDTVYFSNGSATGTIKGNKRDNSTIDEKFNFSHYLDVLNDQYYKADYANQMYQFDIEFYEKNGSTMNIGFELSSLTDITPEDIDFSISYYKNIDNKVFYFHMTEYLNTLSITDFSFDKTTGRTKGKIVVTGQENTTDKNATVEATFDITLKELVE